MKVVMLFDADDDEELCKPDPLDETHARRPHYVEISRNADVVVFWREWGDQFTDGHMTHVYGQGIFENMTAEQIDEAIDAIEAPE